MSISIVNSTQIEIRRLAVAGNDVATGDDRINSLSLEIRKMGETMPVFARLADSIESLTNPEASGSVCKLLEAAALTNALLYAQGVVGVEGELIVPEDSGLDLPVVALYRTISRVIEAVVERGARRLPISLDILDYVSAGLIMVPNVKICNSKNNK